MSTRWNTPGLLYWALDRTSRLVKVGCTSRLRTRMLALRRLESPAGPVDLELLALTPGDRWLEDQLHCRLKNCRASRDLSPGRGVEWYHQTPRILSLARRYRVPDARLIIAPDWETLALRDRSAVQRSYWARYLLGYWLDIVWEMDAARAGFVPPKLQPLPPKTAHTKRRRRKVYPPELVALLGTVPDTTVAGRFGYTQGAVSSIRRKLGITSYQDNQRALQALQRAA